ncbi:hypothetical protein [Aeromonas phage AS-zj]|uniref:Mom n=1 Tax=Aeromonas phage AS-zj TaxID=2024208 RepID=A0A223LEQ1_9CAUD|nr:Mom-like DNA modification protein [Aeromonas phage AS-zj]ASU00231.1 hypothetical protein [Aeromonas phage AS-zj]
MTIKWRDYELSLCERKEIKEFVEAHHYSHNINGLKTSYCFRIDDKNGKLVGSVIFGQLSTTAWKKFSDKEDDVLELRRLVLLDELPHNSESWVIGSCLRILKKLKTHKVVISYADPFHDHVGIIYQATNWIYVGETPKDKLLKTPDGKLYHSRALRTKYKGMLKPFAQRLQYMKNNGLLEEVVVPGKHSYVYPLVHIKKLDKVNQMEQKQYPKQRDIEK